MRNVVLALTGGTLLGGAVGWLVAAAPKGAIERPALALPPSDSPVVPATPTRELADSERVSAERRAAPATSSVDDDGLITEALRAYARAHISAGWTKVREDEIRAEELAEGLKRFERLVLDGPFGIGRALGEQRTKAEQALEDARTGGVFALLTKLDAGGVGPVPTLVKDAGKFEALFQRSAPEVQLDARTIGDHPDKDTSDATTLTWPAGVFRVANLMKEKDPYPRDVTLEGAGMDATMLVVDHALTTRGTLRNFAIRDCTVYASRGLVDLRSAHATVRLDRVRFVGMRGGLFQTRPLALLARQCRFEGGYEGSAHPGQLFDVRTDALLARLDGCKLSLFNLHIWQWKPGTTVVFRDCTLDQMLDDPLKDAERKPGVMFDGCAVTRYMGDVSDVPQLDLNALFPDWKARMED